MGRGIIVHVQLVLITTCLGIPIGATINDLVLLTGGDNAITNGLAIIGIINLVNASLDSSIRNIRIVIPKATLDNAINIDIGGIDKHTTACNIAAGGLAAILDISNNLGSSVFAHSLANSSSIRLIVLLAHIPTNAYNAIGITLGDAAIIGSDSHSATAHRHSILGSFALNLNAVVSTGDCYRALLGINIALHENIGHGSIATFMVPCSISKFIIDRATTIVTLDIDLARLTISRIDYCKIGTGILLIDGANIFIKFSFVGTIYISSIENKLATGVAHSYGINLGQ